MTQRSRSDSVVQEDAVVVGVLLPIQESRRLALDPLEELKGLAESAGAKVQGEVVQRRETPDMTTYLGRGKVEELKNLVEAVQADVVIFDNDLSPAQTRNLEKAIGVKVLDRTELILDIFASRAQTHEARLAVELAQLQYSLPRIKGMWSHLSRIKAGIGMRGPGEKQIETDRRLAEKRIQELQGEIDQIHRRKELLVASRGERMTVSLVGYTNAGKSTLMNVLTGAGVVAKDQLFATLDTRTRRWSLPGWGPVLLSDTVGFIRDLPHNLIASFKATLEEAHQADLLLHVADASNPEVLEQIAAVFKVLKEMHIEEKDTLLVLNKVDSAEPGVVHTLVNRYPSSLRISARSGEGIDKLSEAVAAALSRSFADVDVETAVSDGKTLAYLAAHGEVLSRQFDEERVRVHVRIPERLIGPVLRNTEVKVARRDGKPLVHDVPRPSKSAAKAALAAANGHGSAIDDVRSNSVEGSEVNDSEHDAENVGREADESNAV